MDTAGPRWFQWPRSQDGKQATDNVIFSSQMGNFCCNSFQVYFLFCMCVNMNFADPGMGEEKRLRNLFKDKNQPILAVDTKICLP